MKRFFPFVLLLVAALATAGTYSITTTARQDQRLERERGRLNKASCAAVQLPASCTQAQCRQRQPGCDIYSDIPDMLDRYVLRNYLGSLQLRDTADDAQQFCAWFKAATVAQQNNACALAGLPNGCEICP